MRSNRPISLNIRVSDQVAQGATHIRSGRRGVTNSSCAPITSRGGSITLTYTYGGCDLCNNLCTPLVHSAIHASIAPIKL
jgi:hypothetical protein